MNDTPLIDKDSAVLILAELQRQNDRHWQAADVLDGKATGLLEWASLALVVVSTLSIKDMVDECLIVPFVVLGVTILLYFAVVVVSLKATSPSEFHLPVGLDWEEMSQRYLTLSEQDAVEQLLVQYIHVIERNKESENRKVELTRWCAYLFVALVSSLFLSWSLRFVYV